MIQINIVDTMWKKKVDGVFRCTEYKREICKVIARKIITKT